MMGMSIPYVDTGRTNQKLRTRDALIEAARALIGRGITPTVEEAAVEASISRTTAYRYFPNQRELLVAAHPEIEARSLLPLDAPADVTKRLDIVLDEYLRMTVENEAALRTAFLVSLDTERNQSEQLVLRRGRVIGWLEDALEPLRDRLSAKELRRLASAIRAAAGIEALIWLCDVADLTRDEAVKLMKWSAHALLQAAIADGDQKQGARRAKQTIGSRH
jgi:AcrR family transcriptional regulator